MPEDLTPTALLTDRLLLLPLSRAAMVARVELESLQADHVLVVVPLPQVEPDVASKPRGPAPLSEPARMPREETWRPREVRLPRSWPGDPLPMFPDRIPTMTDDATGSWIVIPRASLADEEQPVAIGMIGTVGPPADGGVQEIGYGMNPEVWGQGYGTEAVAAVVDELLRRDDVEVVMATTALGNLASQRVLQHNGFEQVGTDYNDDDGDLLVWHASRVELSGRAT